MAREKTIGLGDILKKYSSFNAEIVQEQPVQKQEQSKEQASPKTMKDFINSALETGKKFFDKLKNWRKKEGEEETAKSETAKKEKTKADWIDKKGDKLLQRFDKIVIERGKSEFDTTLLTSLYDNINSQKKATKMTLSEIDTDIGQKNTTLENIKKKIDNIEESIKNSNQSKSELPELSQTGQKILGNKKTEIGISDIQEDIKKALEKRKNQLGKEVESLQKEIKQIEAEQQKVKDLLDQINQKHQELKNKISQQAEKLNDKITEQGTAQNELQKDIENYNTIKQSREKLKTNLAEKDLKGKILKIIERQIEDIDEMIKKLSEEKGKIDKKVTEQTILQQTLNKIATDSA